MFGIVPIKNHKFASENLFESCYFIPQILFLALFLAEPFRYSARNPTLQLINQAVVDPKKDSLYLVRIFKVKIVDIATTDYYEIYNI